MKVLSQTFYFFFLSHSFFFPSSQKETIYLFLMPIELVITFIYYHTWFNSLINFCLCNYLPSNNLVLWVRT